MIKTLIFECINSDTIIFNAGEVVPAGTSYELFVTDDNGVDDNVTKVGEEQILEWLMYKAGNLLLNKLQLSQNALVGFSVRRPVVENHDLPDIDMLLCEPLSPQFSVGIQCKRVKVQSIDESKDKINKLPEIKQVVTQTNIQRDKFGFHRNYLLIVTQIFGRNFRNENAIFRKARPETRKRIYDFPQRESLHQDAGVIFVEIGQPTGKSYNKQVNICVCIDKEAARLEQTSKLTNDIQEFFQIRQ